MSKGDFKRKLLVDTLELPADIALDLQNITLIGDEELQVAGHMGLLEYASSYIRIKTKLAPLKVFGTGLIIKEIGAEVVVVAGKIDKFSFD